MSRIKLIFLLLPLFFVSIVPFVFAERKIFTFSADYTEAILAEGSEYTVLRGNAIVTADDIKIEADEIKLYGDDFQFAEVIGDFSAIDLKNDFSLKGNKLLYDRTKKLLRAEGNIVMKDNKNDVGIRAHFLESKNDGEFMIVQLGVRITKSDDLSARTEFLTYYRNTEILEMTGFPFALWKEDEYRADRISINLDTDEVILEGKVRGFISTVQEDNDGENTNEEASESASESGGEVESESGSESTSEEASERSSENTSSESTGENASEAESGNESTSGEISEAESESGNESTDGTSGEDGSEEANEEASGVESANENTSENTDGTVSEDGSE